MLWKVFFLCLMMVPAISMKLLKKRGLPDGAVVNKCPTNWEDPYCSCDINYLSLTSTITCHDVPDVETLKKSLSADVKWNNKDFEWLVLQNVKLASFPNDTLNDMSFTGLIFHNVSVTNMESGVFAGSRDSVEYLWASESNFKDFNFKALVLLGKLRSLAIMASNLTKIASDTFEGLDHLEVINMERNAIARIDTDAFAALPQLRRLELTGNRLTALTDGMLNTSQSVRDVVVLLTENKISEISPGAFAGLKTNNLHLEKNRLKSLKREVFQPLLNDMTKHGKGRLFVRGNPIDCEGVAWLQEDPESLEQVVGLPCKNLNWDTFNSGP